MTTQSKVFAKGKRNKVKMRIRAKIEGTVDRPRVSVFRSSKHTYAQIICDVTHNTLASASTLDPEVKSKMSTGSKEVAASKEGQSPEKASLKSVSAARAVGIVLAERGKANQINKVVFDRNGFLYTGRVKAVADGAREGGLVF